MGVLSSRFGALQGPPRIEMGLIFPSRCQDITVVSWDPVPGATSYKFYKADDAMPWCSVPINLPATQTSFTYPTCNGPGATYVGVRAVDASGEGDSSDVLEIPCCDCAACNC